MSKLLTHWRCAQRARRAWPVVLLGACVLGCERDLAGPRRNPTPPSPPTTLILPSEVTMLVRDSALLVVVGYAADGRATAVRATWVSSDSTVVRVLSRDGMIATLATGTATITATEGEARASTVVTVIELPGAIAFAATDAHGPLHNYAMYITVRRGSQTSRVAHPSGLPLGEPDLAPNGIGLVAHLVHDVELSERNHQDASDIFVLSPTLTWRQITQDGRSRSAAWSPDGQRIAYVSGEYLFSHIYVVDAAGGAARRLTQELGSYWWPRWSPDGRRIAFTKDYDRPVSEIYVMNADGSGLEKVSAGPNRDFNASWSPDGSRLLFYREGAPSLGLWVVDLGTKRVTQLANHGPQDGAGGGTWSPDGRQILYSVMTWDRFIVNPDGRSGIYEVNADGSDPKQITRPPIGAAHVSPTWRR